VFFPNTRSPQHGSFFLGLSLSFCTTSTSRQCKMRHSPGQMPSCGGRSSVGLSCIYDGRRSRSPGELSLSCSCCSCSRQTPGNSGIASNGTARINIDVCISSRRCSPEHASFLPNYTTTLEQRQQPSIRLQPTEIVSQLVLDQFWLPCPHLLSLHLGRPCQYLACRAR